MHRTKKLGRVRAVPRLCGFYPGICLKTGEKAWKINLFKHSFIHFSIHSLIHLFWHSLTHSFQHLLINSFIRSFIHSFRSPSHGRSTRITSSKSSSPQSVIQCFFFYFPVPSLFLKIIQQLLTSSSQSSIHFFYLSFNNVFPKTVSTQDVTNLVNLPPFYSMQNSFPLRLYVTLLHLSYDWSN